jgi:hypothetical protein
MLFKSKKARFIIIVLGVGLFVLLVGNIGNLVFVEYVPVLSVTDAESYYERFPELAHNPEFLDSFEWILSNYNERYHRKNDTLYIYRWLNSDEDLLANYTRKALDRCGREIPRSKVRPKTDRVLDFHGEEK